MYQNKENTDVREIKRGEVYFIDLSNIDYLDSHIIGKSRPGLIIQNNVGNENSFNVIVALLTSAEKKPYPFQYKIILNGRSTTIMFDQIMTVPKANLEDKLGELTEQQMYEADTALMCSLNLLYHSITAIRDFSIESIITEKTKEKETVYCNICIKNIINGRESTVQGILSFDDLKSFDPSLTKDTNIDEIRDKLNNCTGLNFLANHIHF